MRVKIPPGPDPGRWRVLPWVTALLFAACGADDSSPPPPSYGTVTVRDSAGVEIVVSHAPLWTEQQTGSLTPEPVLTLGPDVGSGRFLHTVGDVERLHDDRLVVENRGSAELLVFDSTGAFLESWGGRGEGPGEFGRMLGLFTCGGDRLVEVEPRRLTFLDEDGGMVRTASLPSEVVGSGHVVRGVARDCNSVFVTGLDETLYRPTGLGTHSHEMRAFRASLAGSEVDTLGVFRGIESLPGPRGRPGARLPFAYASNWATDGERIYYGWGDRPEITVLGSEGDVERLIRWDARPHPVTDADWAAYERDRRRRSDRDPRLASTYASREEHPHSDTEPYFGPPDAFGSAFVLSDRGELWVRRFDRFLLRDERRPAPPTGWWIFAADGRWLGSVETPARFEVRSVRGDLVLGVARDELDRESVRVYRMVGRER